MSRQTCGDHAFGEEAILWRWDQYEKTGDGTDAHLGYPQGLEALDTLEPALACPEADFNGLQESCKREKRLPLSVFTGTPSKYDCAQCLSSFLRSLPSVSPGLSASVAHPPLKVRLLLGVGDDDIGL